jgi:4,5-dihydroxyphthalate decarboxylase
MNQSGAASSACSIRRYRAILPWLPTYARNVRDLFGGDPYPFGIEENRPTLELFLQYAFEQGIAHRHAKPDEIFPPGIMVSVKI